MIIVINQCTFSCIKLGGLGVTCYGIDYCTFSSLPNNFNCDIVGVVLHVGRWQRLRKGIS